MRKGKTKENLWNCICSILLFLYPFRHIHWGLDLWDTGYNYANFQYMGLEHMDSMWLFSTYLSNVVGNLLTKLPFGHSLVGMNFYTGLFVSALALAGYWFCINELRISAWITFLGELIAISLCWCPTALLYNYLTYVLFLGCVILIYLGLCKKKSVYLFGAGICLGCNVLVRFPNLPEATLIIGVWAYAVIEGLEDKRERNRCNIGKQIWQQIWKNTLWCLGGYLLALAVLFGYLQVRYGLNHYIEGIARLFSMTDNATDYKPTAMIMGLIGAYVENLYWVIRIGVFIGAGMICFGVATFCLKSKRLRILPYGVSVLLALVLLWWLYKKGFCSQQFFSYGAILWPGVTFLMLTLGIAVVRILHPGCPKEEKLISGLLFLVLLLTSIGSNNKVYPSMNNLFVAAPYTLWESWRFIRQGKEWRFKRLVISTFPMKTVLVAFLGLFIFQTTLFGVNFVFVEGTGAQQVTATVENNEVLNGIKMHPERAGWMQDISDYAAENNLKGRQVILYGDIPSLSYYLQMPSAFNPWSDLRSYSLKAMEEDIQETRDEMHEEETKRPLVIVENRYVRYWEEGVAALEEMELLETTIEKITTDKKWLLLIDFMEENGYHKTFENEKFSIYE